MVRHFDASPTSPPLLHNLGHCTFGTHPSWTTALSADTHPRKEPPWYPEAHMDSRTFSAKAWVWSHGEIPPMRANRRKWVVWCLASR